MKKFYVYALLDPFKPGKYKFSNVPLMKYEPFYIGKGQNYRYLAHFNENVETTANPFKINKIKKILKKGKIPLIQKIFTDLIDTHALNLEKLLIKKIGRRNLGKGPLTNLTDGGEGVSGWHHTIASSKKISESNRKRKISLKTRKKISKSVKMAGFKWTKKMRDAQRERVSGNKCIFHKIKFVGKDNYMFGKSLSKHRRKILSKIASGRIGGLNPNSKYYYCIYDTISKKTTHKTSNLSKIVGKSFSRFPWKIIRHKQWIIARYKKLSSKCPCKRLLRISLNRINETKNAPVVGYLKPKYQRGQL